MERKKIQCKKAESYSRSGTIRIIVDTKTGVSGSSITPLLDGNGNVVIDN